MVKSVRVEPARCHAPANTPTLVKHQNIEPVARKGPGRHEAGYPGPYDDVISVVGDISFGHIALHLRP